MSKFKHDIAKKHLSWERVVPKRCDYFNCNEIGEYKAPKSRSDLNDYYFFCLKHVSKYNKSWDFYKGLTTDEIEHAMRQDTVWDRPSWPLKGNPDKIISQIDEIIKEDFSIYSNEKDTGKFFKNKLVDETLTKDQHKALEILSLNLPLTMEKIKKKYKKLVKIFHPDVNGNNKDAENKFKEINESYKILLKKFVK